MVKQRHTTDMETQVKKEPIGYAMVPADVSRAPRRMPTAPMNDAEEASRYVRERDQIEWTDGFDAAMQRKDLSITASKIRCRGLNRVPASTCTIMPLRYLRDLSPRRIVAVLRLDLSCASTTGE